MFSRRQRVVICTISMFCPVLMPSGINRLLYFGDLMTPLLLYWGVQRWKAVGSYNRTIFALLLLSAGILPALTSGLYASDQVFQITAWVNCWRVVAICSIFLIFSDPTASIFKVADVVRVIGWLAIGLNLILAAQIWLGLNTNLYAMLVDLDADVGLTALDPNKRYWILGMFKGEIGYLAMIFLAVGLVSFISQFNEAKKTSFVLILASLVLLITSGSKTSILCSALFPFILLITRPGRLFKKEMILIAVILSGIGMLLLSGQLSEYLNQTLVNYISSGGADAETLDYRTATWVNVVDQIFRQPLGFLGIYFTPVNSFSIGYFHNEYLGIGALGGIQSLILYLLALTLLFKKFAKPSTFSQDAKTVAFVVLAGGLLQGFTIAHIQPSILFFSSVGFAMMIYGMGARREMRLT
jgi:hypothetical protein